MTGRYATDTSVPADRSRAEIERTVRRYGATGFGYGWENHTAVIAFAIADRHVRLRLTMPDPADRQFTRTPTGKPRSQAQADAAWEQACRSLWRALALVVKAKLEAVAAGISTVEREFLADTVTPNGATVHEMIGGQLALAYRTGTMPALLQIGPPA